MANEIQFQLQLRLNNDDLSDTYTTSSIRIAQSVARLVRNVQQIGTTEEAIDTGDVITPGYAVFVNLEDAGGNFVEVGSYIGGTFYPFIKVKPGEQQMLRIAVTTAQLYAKADTGNVEMFYIIYND